jgi:hypothetical protein
MVSYLPRYCTNCGAANQPQAGFCFACDQALQALADTTPLSSAASGSLAPSHLHKQRNVLNAIPRRVRHEVETALLGVWAQPNEEGALTQLAASTRQIW